MKSMLIKIFRIVKYLIKIEENLDQIKINQGLMLEAKNLLINSKRLCDYEFKIFSQWGDDGIISHIINNVDVKNKTFIEFGVEDFYESNCRYILQSKNWSGFILDGSKKNISKIYNSYFVWKYNLNAKSVFLTTDNINESLSESDFDKDLGILSIDIDGNDYFIFESISYYRPRILIMEYNACFGKQPVSIPYNKNYIRNEAHSSNLFFGCSLSACCHLARIKGYIFIGSNSAANNAYFLREDVFNDKFENADPDLEFRKSSFREGRNNNGSLSLNSFEKNALILKGLPVLNVVDKKIVPFIGVYK